MITDDRRVRIICGHYGCGKTEFAVNYAVKLAEAGYNPLLADIDVINPYFRSREQAEYLEKLGVSVVSSSINASAIDVQAISAGVYSAFDSNRHAVIDVGGDRAGMSVLKRFSDHFNDSELDLLFVINVFRQEVSEPSKIIDYINSFQEISGLSVTGLINNSHMLKSTTADILIRGQQVSDEVSSLTGIPVLYHSGMADLKNSLPDGIRAKFFPLNLYMRDDWMS